MKNIEEINVDNNIIIGKNNNKGNIRKKPIVSKKSNTKKRRVASKVEKNLQDTEEGKKLYSCVRRLGLKEKLLENWKVVIFKRKFAHFKIYLKDDKKETNGKTKEIENLMYALCYIYETYNNSINKNHFDGEQRFGGYLSEREAYFFEGPMLPKESQRYDKLGVQMLKSFAINDQLYSTNNFIYYRYTDNDDDKVKLAVGKIAAILKHPKMDDQIKEENKGDGKSSTSSSSDDSSNSSSSSSSSDSETDDDEEDGNHNKTLSSSSSSSSSEEEDDDDDDDYYEYDYNYKRINKKKGNNNNNNK